MARHGSRIRKHRPGMRRVRQAREHVEGHNVSNAEEGVPHPGPQNARRDGELGVRHETVRDDGTG